MRLTTSSRVYYRPSPPKMPSGLVELMEGLTREVLKNNPTDLYGFCAGHIEHLLEIRDGPQSKKSLSLQQKIAKAQEKVRQRAEKRRQQYDKELLLRRKSPESSTPHENDSLQQTTATGITQIIVSQELANSSEIEISHKPDIDIHSTDEANAVKDEVKIEEDVIKTSNAIRSVPTESMIKDELIPSESMKAVEVESLTDTPTKEPEDMKSEIINDLSTPIQSSNNTAEPTSDEQVTIVPETKTESSDSAFKDVDNDNLASIVVETVGELKDDKDSMQHDKEADEDDGDKNKDTNPESNIQISDSKEVLDESTKLEIENNNLALDEEKVNNETNDTQSTPPLDQHLEDAKPDRIDDLKDEQPAAEITDNQNNPETNTITVCFQESPALDLQSPLLNSDLLETLSATDTDSEATTATLINQDSIKEEDLSNPTKPDEIVKELQVNKETIESDSITSNDEINHDNGLELNHGDNTDSIENFDIEPKNITSNINENENPISTNQNDGRQGSNQDSNMDLETAAITIQKVFRTFMFKSRNSTFDDDAATSDETNFLDEDDKTKVECNFPVTSLNMERRSHGLTRMDTVLQTVNEEKSLSLSTDDSSTLSSAATVIQAHVRGFLVRNRLNSNKTISTNSLAASNPSLPSLEMDNDPNRNKTVLNIHIVPEGGNYLSRDESLLTSMDLSLDNSPPSSVNLHPLGNDKIIERRKQLKREDAIQSISPPSNNSGKLSEDVDSVKELPLSDPVVEQQPEHADSLKDDNVENTDNALVLDTKRDPDSLKDDNVENTGSAHVLDTKRDDLESTVDSKELTENTTEPNVDQTEIKSSQEKAILSKQNSDEMDVVSPFISNEDKSDSKLMHSGEFHDGVLPTKVSRSDTSVASEFKNVLVYFLLWNNS
ncbi:uncharacterized protein LOC113504894 [Trichoplusia ni]|uniref:Uncharacterized protein LOC113504894 n=1 Tax=Trichoplusia ni TaxID=7111 RepID=A0A7E5WRD1_TRINI|nr:uncharacterized protein LOC113504894 [Trichoplusia ni]